MLEERSLGNEHGKGVASERLFVAGLLGLAVVLGPICGCQSFNPSFLEDLGISPISSLETPPGSVIVVLINRTAFPAELRIQVLEADGFSGTETLFSPGNSFFVTATDCEVSQITFQSMTVTTFGTTGTNDVDVAVPQTPLTGGFNFRCGNVVSVTVTGTNENFDVSVQVL